MSSDDQCYFCRDGRGYVLETHHIVPRRFGGSDDDNNLVTLCASCHRALEKLYDDGRLRMIGVSANEEYERGRERYYNDKEYRKNPNEFHADALKYYLEDVKGILTPVEEKRYKSVLRASDIFGY